MSTIPIIKEDQEDLFTGDKCESCIHYGTTEYCVGTYPADCTNYEEEETN